MSLSLFGEGGCLKITPQAVPLMPSWGWGQHSPGCGHGMVPCTAILPPHSPKFFPPCLLLTGQREASHGSQGCQAGRHQTPPTEGHCSGLCSLQPPGSQGSPLWTLLCQDPSLPLSAHRQPGTPPQWPEPPTLHCLTKLAHEEGVFLKKGAAFPTKGSAPSQAGWLAATSIIHKNSFSGLITAAHTSCLPPHNHPAMKKY